MATEMRFIPGDKVRVRNAALQVYGKTGIVERQYSSFERLFFVVKFKEVEGENQEISTLMKGFSATDLQLVIDNDKPQPKTEPSDVFVQTVDWPNSSGDMVGTPEFQAVWHCIKSWDINVPGAYAGHCGATGNHVRAIVDALEPVIQERIAQITLQKIVTALNEKIKNGD